MSKEKSEIRVSYDPVADDLVVRWAEPVGVGSYDVTNHNNISVCLDDEDNIIGFMLENVSKINSPAQAVLATPGQIGVREAAEKMGLSERRVRQLIMDGRLKAKRNGGAWALEPSLNVLPAKRGRPRAAASESGPRKQEVARAG